MADDKKTTTNPADLKSGNIRFYEHLFKEYYRPLVVFAMKYVRDSETAKEIVQDFFVKLYEKRMTIDIDTSLKSYLFRSVYNSCINHLSYLEMRKKHLKNLSSLSQDDYTDDQVAQIELQNRIYACIEGMPSQCRKIFTMNRFEGLRNEQIADQLKLSKRTVETQISKALKILRKKLADYFILLVLVKLLII